MKLQPEIRRENIRLLEAEAGSPQQAANLLGMSYAQYVNLRDGAKDSKTGKPRGMRDETARKIESKFGKSIGWLDIDHGQQKNGSTLQLFHPPLPVQRKSITKVISILEKMDDLGLGQVLLFAKQTLKDHSLEGHKKRKSSA